MVALILQALISLLFLLFVFGLIEHVFGNKRGKLPRKRELLLDVIHAAFNQVITRRLTGVAVLALAIAILTPLVVGGVDALDAKRQFRQVMEQIGCQQVSELSRHLVHS